MAEIGPAISGLCMLPRDQTTLDGLRESWKRTLNIAVSDAVLTNIDRARCLYIAAHDIQSRMANAAKVRDILAKVETKARAIYALLSDSSEEARTALARLGPPLDPGSILQFLAQLESSACERAKTPFLRRGPSANPAFEVLIHRLDRICDQAGANTVIAFNGCKSLNDDANDDYSAGYVSPYLDFLVELLTPHLDSELPTTRGAFAKAVQRARRKDIRYAEMAVRP